MADSTIAVDHLRGLYENLKSIYDNTAQTEDSLGFVQPARGDNNRMKRINVIIDRNNPWSDSLFIYDPKEEVSFGPNDQRIGESLRAPFVLEKDEGDEKYDLKAGTASLRVKLEGLRVGFGVHSGEPYAKPYLDTIGELDGETVVYSFSMAGGNSIAATQLLCSVAKAIKDYGAKKGDAVRCLFKPFKTTNGKGSYTDLYFGDELIMLSGSPTVEQTWESAIPYLMRAFGQTEDLKRFEDVGHTIPEGRGEDLPNFRGSKGPKKSKKRQGAPVAPPAEDDGFAMDDDFVAMMPD